VKPIELYVLKNDKYDVVKFMPVKRTATNRSKSGAECTYIQLTSKTGVKLYYTKGEATRAFKRQLKAYKHSLAPDVLSDVEQFLIRNRNNFIVQWGYYTQVVETFNSFKQICRKSNDIMAINKLATSLDNIGLNRDDLHDRNIGFIDNHFVAIDFGDMSS
jgi:hypothetical protein